MKRHVLKSNVKKVLAILLILIFICQMFYPFVLNYMRVHEVPNTFTPADSPSPWSEMFDEDSDVRILDYNGDTLKLEVSISDLKIENTTVPNIDDPIGNVYQRISIDKGALSGAIGAPKLPFRTVKILLPYGKDVKVIKIITGKEHVLKGTFKIKPAQAPIPLSSTKIPEFSLNATVYESLDSLPEERHSVVGVFNSRGYRILILNLYPVSYIPKTGVVSHFKDMKVRINLIDSPEVNSLFRGLEKDEDHVKKLVDTPQLMDTYARRFAASTSLNLASSSESFLLRASGDVMGDSGPYDYVIITNETLRDSTDQYNFTTLAAAKSDSGINTTIVTVEDIYANYAGVDAQEEIRNFIIDAYANWGIEYVLLGGDGDGADVGGESGDDIIPARLLTFFEFSCGPTPADIYYAGLDGTWNDDGDDIWGEFGEEDNPDLLAEVYVGRAPVDSEEELSNFVRKTLAHENATASNDLYLSKVLMVGEDMMPWSGMARWGGNFMDQIINGSVAYGYFTEGFPGNYNITTLYERDGDWDEDTNKAPLVDKITAGVHILNHLGHASNTEVMGMIDEDVADLQNEQYFFGYSQGCFAGAFDNIDEDGNPIEDDSIVEHFVTSENGSFAFIANGRYGLDDPNSLDGFSQHYHREFIDAICGEGIKEIGRANQDSKEDSIGFITESWMLIVYYEINLFGDPTAVLSGHDYDQVYIDGNDALKGNATGGNGTSWEDACEIDGEDRFYNGTCSSIEIHNTDLYLRIQNCTIWGNSSSYNDGYAGIELVNCTNVKIINCTINNTYRGIYLTLSDDNFILKNNISNSSGTGIYLEGCDNITLSENLMNQSGVRIEGSLEEISSHDINTSNKVNGKSLYFYANGSNLGSVNFTNAGQVILVNCNDSAVSNMDISSSPAGISLYYCHNNTISKNNVSNNSYHGIYLSSSTNNTLINNTANYNGQHGISLSSSTNNTLTNNTAYNNTNHGIYLSSSTNNTLTNNTANNNSYGIILWESSNNTLINNTAIDDDFYGIYLWDSDLNTLLKNTVNNNYRGIDLHASSNNTLSNNTANTNVRCGIFLVEASHNTLSNNTANDNGVKGIYLSISSHNMLINNTAYNNQNGIHLMGYCDDNTLTNNTANNNNLNGIYLCGYCDDNTLTHNTANDNTWYGIYLYIYCDDNTLTHNTANDNTKYGIYLHTSDKNVVACNTANENTLDGIQLYDSDSNTISGNNASINMRYGISMAQNSSSNMIYINSFIGNSVSNAMNMTGYSGPGNSWDNGVFGNYWGDYDSTGASIFRIVWNTSYEITGSTSDSDNYPLVKEPAEDFDGDKVSNVQECLRGSDPWSVADVDKDGMPEYWESYFGLNDIIWNQDFDYETVDSVPENWNSENFMSVKGPDHIEPYQFFLNETAGVDRINEQVTVTIENISTGTCFHDSPRLYDLSNVTENSSQTWNRVMHQNASEWTWSSSSDWDDNPHNWINSDGGTAESLLLPRYRGFKKVLRQTDTHAVDFALAAYTFASNIIDDGHVFEVWFRFEGSNPISSTNGFVGADQTLQAASGFGLDTNGNLVDHDGNVIVASISKDVWHHGKIVVNFTSDTSKFYIDFSATPDYTGDNNGRTHIKFLLFATATSGQQAADSPVFWAYPDHYATGIEGENQFCESFDITFLANVSASSTVTMKVNYSSTSLGDPGYSGLSRSTNTITCSDGTKYEFQASEDDRFVKDGDDSDGNDWNTAMGDTIWDYTTPLTGSVAVIWLESGPIFSDSIYYYDSNEYSAYRTYDNNLIKTTHMRGSAWHYMTYNSYLTSTFIEHWRYHASGSWSYKKVKSHDAYVTVDEGKYFYDDTDDKMTINLLIWDEDSDSVKQQWVGNNSNTVAAVRTGFNGSSQLLADTEYTFYLGIVNVSSTSTTSKTNYVDDLYTSVIDSPLELGSIHFDNNFLLINDGEEFTSQEGYLTFSDNVTAGRFLFDIRVDSLPGGEIHNYIILEDEDGNDVITFEINKSASETSWTFGVEGQDSQVQYALSTLYSMELTFNYTTGTINVTVNGTEVLTNISYNNVTIRQIRVIKTAISHDFEIILDNLVLTNETGLTGPDEDFDGNEGTNLEEYVNGTDPTT